MFFQREKIKFDEDTPVAASFAHSGRSNGKNRGDDHAYQYFYSKHRCARVDSAVRSCLSLLTCVPLSFPTPDNARRAVYKTDIKGTYRGCRIQSLATRICDLSDDLTEGGSSERVEFVRCLVSENYREKAQHRRENKVRECHFEFQRNN